MARLGVKHKGQRSVSYADFSGGLNTSNAEEMIAENELSRAINVELDKSTGLLRTAAGTLSLYDDEDRTFRAMAWDAIGETFLVVDTLGKVYSWACGGALSEKGTLTGGLFPSFAAWEDGMLVASGGKLQYFHGGALETISSSPSVCNGVFIKSGRVVTYHGDRLEFSAVGDEQGWTEASDDDSSAKWLDVGYKDGGKIAGVTNLTSDILVFKDNGHAYHLYGEYPDWALKEISREVGCRGFRACCSIANEALVLSRSMVQSVRTTEAYGDMRAEDVSRKVENKILDMPQGVHIRYIPALNQVWFVEGSKRFLFLDVHSGGYFEREFNGHVQDALSVGDTVYVLKPHAIQRLDADSGFDEGLEVRWDFKCKTLVSPNEYLVKRARADITPFTDYNFSCTFRVGNVVVDGTLPKSAQALYEDWTYLYDNRRSLWKTLTAPAYNNSDELYGNDDYLYENETELMSLNMYRTDARCVERLRSVGVQGKGFGGQCMFNAISFELAEV